MTPTQRQAIFEAKRQEGEFPVLATAHIRRRTAESLLRRGLFEVGPGSGSWGTVYRLTTKGWEA